MTETQQTDDLKMYFHLVLAEVIFETKRGGVTSHRVQFMTQAKVNEFPANRIHQLQNSAGHAVLEKIGPGRGEGFKVHDVLFLSIHPCGYMPIEEFYGKGMTAKADIKEADTSSVTDPVSNDETANEDNVVPINRTT